MDTLFKIVDFLNHKEPFRYLKGPLNLLFVFSISYTLYSWAFPTAPTVGHTDRVTVVTYILHGEYIIPMGVYLLVWAATRYLGMFIFRLSNMLISERARKWILEKSFLKAFGADSTPEQQSEIIAMAKAPSGEWVVNLYKYVRSRIPEKKFNKLKNTFEETQYQCSEEFILHFRALIVLIISFVTVSYFGWVTFTLLLIFLFCSAAILFFGYQLTVVLPILAYKLGKEIDDRDKKEDKGDE